MIEILFLLFVAHFVADYPLQGDFLSRAKAAGPLRVYHLCAHCGIQAGGVFIVTNSLPLALAEFAAHVIIDESKTRNWITFAQDQALHLACKVVWWLWLTGYLITWPDFLS